MASVSAGLSSYQAAHATDRLAGLAWGPFLDSASTLFWGAERARSGELPEDSSSSAGGSLSPMRMGSLPLFD